MIIKSLSLSIYLSLSPTFGSTVDFNPLLVTAVVLQAHIFVLLCIMITATFNDCYYYYVKKNILIGSYVCVSYAALYVR